MKLSWLLLAAVCWLQGCGPGTPIPIGFIGTLSRGASDVGEAGRNGAILAVEELNAKGGLQGRPVRLLVEDDAQAPERAQQAFQSLQAAGAQLIIGPFTSAMAATLVPLANAARLPMISPTVTSMDFYGQDDYLIRIHRTTRDNASDYAQRLRDRGQLRLAVAFDLRNKSFSQSWLKEFRDAFTARGGRLLVERGFESGEAAPIGDIVRALLAPQPDGLLFIANAVESARLGQRARLLAPNVALATAEWAASETLIELGGQSIDGMLVLQPFDRDDPSPRYAAFRAAYRQRFQREPGYSAVAAYDAVQVALVAIGERERRQSLKESLLSGRAYQGLQQQMVFDRFGDTQRRTVFNEVRDGRFVALP